MIKGIRIVLSLTVCFMLIGAFGQAPSAQAAPATPPQFQQIFSKSGDAGIRASQDSATAIAAMWTAEARQAAKPLDVNFKASDLAGLSADTSVGAPVYKPGGAPNAEALAKWTASNNRQATDLPTLQAPSLITPQGTKGVFDGYPGNYNSIFYSSYPFYAVGRLYFQDNIGSYWCTAALISPNNVAVTAAHCMWNADAHFWYYNFAFVPDDYYGSGPEGVFPYTIGWVNVAWRFAKKSSSALAYDVGVLQFEYNPVQYFGWLGYTMNQSTKSLVTNIGYTGNFFGGGPTWVCVAETYPKKSGVIGQGCDMDNSSTGTPGIFHFAPFYAGVNINLAEAVIIGAATGTNIYSTIFTTKNLLTICTEIGC